jgi:hypothetical protein
MRVVWFIVLAVLTVPAGWYSVTYVHVLNGAREVWGEMSADFFLHPRLTVYHRAGGLIPQPDGPPTIGYAGGRGVDWFRIADPPTGVDPEQWSIPSLVVAAPSSALVLVSLGYMTLSFKSRRTDDS